MDFPGLKMEGLDWISLQEEGRFEDDGLTRMTYGNVNNVRETLNNPVQKMFLPWNAMEDSGNALIPDPGMLPGSLESLDCLLSASNSQTDTASMEDDDGISMIFSDCSKGLWNFTPVKPGQDPDEQPVINPPAMDHQNQVNQANQANRNPTKRKRSDTYDGITLQNPDFPTPPGTNTNNNTNTSFHFASENKAKSKRPRQDISTTANATTSSNNISFQQPTSSSSSGSEEPDAEAIAQMKEMIYRAAAFRPVNFGAETVEKPKRKNVRISSDPQTVAARQRRERISERIRVLQKLVPGGSKMDTASMLDEAANYLKFLRSQVKALEAFGQKIDQTVTGFPGNPSFGFSPFVNYTFAQPHQFSVNSSVNKPLS